MVLSSKLWCLGLTVCMGSIVAHADNIQIATAQSSTPQVFTITNDTKIVFDGDALVVKQSDGDSSFTLANITEITFDIEASSLETIESQLSEDVAIQIASGVVTVTSPSETPLNIAVYAINGRLIYQRQGVTSDVIDFTTMQSGVYIIKANNKVIKFTR
jgi:hypothetical protein